jgi:hypothetical protein
MTRYASAPAILILVGVPIAVEPSWLVAVPALLAGILCAAGLVRRSLGLIVTGGVGVMMVLTAALWWSSSSLSVLGALAFGLALLLLVDTVGLAHRFSGATVEAPTLRLHVAWWIGRATVVLATGAILPAIASAVALALPLYGRPILAGVGALIAFVAAMFVSGSRHTPYSKTAAGER